MLVPVLVRLEREAKEAIDLLSKEDGAPIAHHFRQAVELYLRTKKRSISTDRIGIGKDL